MDSTNDFEDDLDELLQELISDDSYAEGLTEMDISEYVCGLCSEEFREHVEQVMLRHPELKQQVDERIESHKALFTPEWMDAYEKGIAAALGIVPGSSSAKPEALAAEISSRLLVWQRKLEEFFSKNIRKIALSIKAENGDLPLSGATFGYGFATEEDSPISLQMTRISPQSVRVEIEIADPALAGDQIRLTWEDGGHSEFVELAKASALADSVWAEFILDGDGARNAEQGKLKPEFSLKEE